MLLAQGLFELIHLCIEVARIFQRMHQCTAKGGKEMHNKTILLVDDDRILLESFSHYLGKNAYEVTTAISGEDALIQYYASHFDMVITDLVMDGMSGMEVLQEIKKNQSDICVFILSGYADSASIIEAFHSGVDDFILKPCDAGKLLYKVGYYLQKQEERRAKKGREKILTLCAYCRKIRNDIDTQPGAGEWLQVEEYFLINNGISISHGCCPSCYEGVSEGCRPA